MRQSTRFYDIEAQVPLGEGDKITFVPKPNLLKLDEPTLRQLINCLEVTYDYFYG